MESRLPSRQLTARNPERKRETVKEETASVATWRQGKMMKDGGGEDGSSVQRGGWLVGVELTSDSQAWTGSDSQTGV